VNPSTVATRLAGRRRQLASAAVIGVALGLLGMLYAALAPSGQASTSADPAVQRGEALFNQACASCHGFSAAGGRQALSLIGVGAASVDFQMGTGRMPLQHFGPEAPRKRVVYSEWQRADTAYGGALFRTNCAQCHNFAGSGGDLTYGKYAPSLSDATPKQIYEAMITGPENMPVFGDKQITPDQKLAIIKYVRTLKTEVDPGGVGLGRVGPVSETMIGWLAGIGVLVIVTIWIGARA
jgi:ubiquinol-cytochrome c reductase cytochrome c subunit